MSESKVKMWQLIQRQSLPLDVKIKLSQTRIREFHKSNKGKVYIAYSGGKDSEVMLHLIRSCFIDVKAVFVDTGTELQTRDHAIKRSDIVLHPKISMLEVWKKYGIPFPTKQQAHFIYQAKHTKSDYLRKRLTEGVMKDGSKTMFKVSKKWLKVVESDIEVSDQCCYYLKKEPFHRYNKQTGEHPYVATMAADSMERKKNYLKNGCIDFTKNVCHPLGFWTEQDILEYIVRFDLDLCSAYGEIVKEDGEWKTTKANRTGCVGCGFGVSLEPQPNRFQRIAEEDPRLHDIIINKWCDGAMGKALRLCNIPHGKE